jgi:pilus assembly protein TadC
VSAPELLAGILLAAAAAVVWRPSRREVGLARLRMLSPHRRQPVGLPRDAFLRRLPALRRRPQADLAAGTVANAADLLAACLDAGAVPAAALQAAGEAPGGRIGELLSAAGHALASGEPVPVAFAEAEQLRPVAAIIGRSLHTGSAMTDQLTALAEQLRADDHFDRLERAQRVGVLSALPLGMCLLPAFVLLAVVPAVLGLSTGIPH